MDLAALAQAAYEGYGEAAGWTAVTGDRMPAWDQLSARLRASWVAAVASVRDVMLDELRKDLGKG